MSSRNITISDVARNDLRKELKEWFEDEEKGNEELKQAEARLAKLKRMEKSLQQLMLEEKVSLEDFKEHRARIEAKRARLQNTTDTIKQR